MTFSPVALINDPNSTERKCFEYKLEWEMRTKGPLVLHSPSFSLPVIISSSLPSSFSHRQFCVYRILCDVCEFCVLCDKRWGKLEDGQVLRFLDWHRSSSTKQPNFASVCVVPDVMFGFKQFRITNKFPVVKKIRSSKRIKRKKVKKSTVKVKNDLRLSKEKSFIHCRKRKSSNWNWKCVHLQTLSFHLGLNSIFPAFLQSRCRCQRKKTLWP